MLLLAASLFFTEPLPLEMPRAEAYLMELRDVKESETNVTYRLEDRFDPFDLWTTRAVIGRWYDEENRIFTLSRLDCEPPPLANDAPKTRTDYVAGLVRVNPKKPRRLAEAIALLSPVGIAAEPERPHQLPRGFKAVNYWQGTNTEAIVCAYWPERTNVWYLATWELAEGDDFDERREKFEDEFLGRQKAVPYAVPPATKGSERELLRSDARHAVAAYPRWHATDAHEYTVLDNLSARGFAETLTNELPRMRAKYAAAIPSPVDGKDVLCVARIFSDRDDYLEAVGEDMEWTAAYWCPRRREIVAFLPPRGSAELLKTFRHEAFHQYLSYATSMLQTSPWFNEGYAEYFEDADRTEIGLPVDLDALAQAIPAFVKIGYAEFYDDNDAKRRLNYAFAWSIAYFIENGCPDLRFEPFKDLKRDYVATLLATRDPRRATDAAFGSPDKLTLFLSEWKRFWKSPLSERGRKR